jgi:uncharacterized protein with GYD domain
MATFVSLIRFTDRGVQGLEAMAQHVRHMQNQGPQAGVKLLAWYLTLGEYDAVAIAEAPDDETMIQALLQLGKEGAVRTSTLKAFPLEEFERMVRPQA